MIGNANCRSCALGLGVSYTGYPPPGPQEVFRGPPSGMTDAAHSKCAQIGAKRTIPSHSPEHTGPRALPRPRNSRGMGPDKRVWDLTTKRSVQAVRREAVAAQIQAFGGLFCAAHTTPAAKFSVGGGST